MSDVHMVLAIILIAITLIMLSKLKKRETANKGTPAAPTVATPPADPVQAPSAAGDNDHADEAGAVVPTTEIPVTFYKDGVKGEGILEMAQGLQVFDGAGNTILDMTTSLVKYLGTLHIPASPATGSFSVPALADGDLWYVVIGLDNTGGWFDSNNEQHPNDPPYVYKDGTYLKYKYLGSGTHTGATILYGIK